VTEVYIDPNQAQQVAQTMRQTAGDFEAFGSALVSDQDLWCMPADVAAYVQESCATVGSGLAEVSSQLGEEGSTLDWRADVIQQDEANGTPSLTSVAQSLFGPAAAGLDTVTVGGGWPGGEATTASGSAGWEAEQSTLPTGCQQCCCGYWMVAQPTATATSSASGPGVTEETAGNVAVIGGQPLGSYDIASTPWGQSIEIPLEIPFPTSLESTGEIPVEVPLPTLPISIPSFGASQSLADMAVNSMLTSSLLDQLYETQAQAETIASPTYHTRGWFEDGYDYNQQFPSGVDPY
jgi:hypothetical protein